MENKFFFYEDKRDSLSLYFTGLMYLVVRYHLLGQETKQVNKKWADQLYKDEYNEFVECREEMDIWVSILVSTSRLNL